MDRYKCKELRGNNWIGIFQTKLNWKNMFQLYWCFINTSLHPRIEFGFTLFGFVIPIIDRHRSLFGVHVYTWDSNPALEISINVFFLPSIDCQIGNGRTWFYFRNDNIMRIILNYKYSRNKGLPF